MRKSVTQEFDFGCGIACYAFALNITYRQAEEQLGEQQAHSNRFWVKDLTMALNTHGMRYYSKHLKLPAPKWIYEEGVIVLIRRSKRYPTGHYLIRHNGLWMDPWINLVSNTNILHAQSGYRKRLPGTPMYAIFHVQSLKKYT